MTPLLFLLLWVGVAILAVAFTARKPLWGVCFVLLLLPTYLVRGVLGPVPTTVLEAAIIGMSIGWTVFVWRTGLGLRAALLQGWRRWRMRHLLWPIVLLEVASLLAVVVAPDVWRALGVWRAFVVEPLLFLWVATFAIQSRHDWVAVVHALAIPALVCSVVAIVQVVGGIGLVEGYDGLAGSQLRATGVFPYPGALGLFLTPVLVLLFGVLFFWKRLSRSSVQRWWLMLAALLGVVALALAQTEGAWIAVVVGVSVLALARFSWWRVLLVGLAGVLLVAVSPAAPRLWSAVTLQDTSGEVRLAIWEGTVNLLRDRPVVGAGLGGFSLVYKDYKLDRHVEETILFPHSFLLNTWVELTIFGALAFVLLVGWFVWAAWKRRSDPLVVVVAAAFAAVLVYGLVDVPFFKNDLAVVWWVLFVLLFVRLNRPVLAQPERLLPRTDA